LIYLLLIGYLMQVSVMQLVEHIQSSEHHTLVLCKDLLASMTNIPANMKHKHTHMHA